MMYAIRDATFADLIEQQAEAHDLPFNAERAALIAQLHENIADGYEESMAEIDAVVRGIIESVS